MSQAFTGQEGDAVLDTVRAACTRREVLILATSTAKADGNFVGIEAGCFHAVVDASVDDVLNRLDSSELQIRFPAGGRFLEGPVRILGNGYRHGRRTTRLSFPATLSDGDQRRAYRTERVRRIPISFMAPGVPFCRGALMNLSVSGAKVRAIVPLDEAITTGSSVSVTIPLETDLKIDTWAVVRHVDGRSFGVEFDPPLAGALQERLSRWIFLRKEEDLAALNTDGMKTTTLGEAAAAGDGIVLLSSDPAVEETMRNVIGNIAPLDIQPLTAQGASILRNTQARLMAIVHAKDFDPSARKRTRILLDSIRDDIPVFLLGTGSDMASLSGMATEIRANGHHLLDIKKPSVLLPRMIQGIWNQTEQEKGKRA